MPSSGPSWAVFPLLLPPQGKSCTPVSSDHEENIKKNWQQLYPIFSEKSTIGAFMQVLHFFHYLPSQYWTHLYRGPYFLVLVIPLKFFLAKESLSGIINIKNKSLRLPFYQNTPQVWSPLVPICAAQRIYIGVQMFLFFLFSFFLFLFHWNFEKRCFQGYFRLL